MENETLEIEMRFKREDVDTMHRGYCTRLVWVERDEEREPPESNFNWNKSIQLEETSLKVFQNKPFDTIF